MKHILITGTGRAGTTLLVQIFTRLGFDTGLSMSQAKVGVDPIARAGLEPDLRQVDSLPHVIKAPGRADELKALLSEKSLELEAGIVPMRDLFSAAESRRNVYTLAAKAGKNPIKHPGSLWKTRKPEEQEGQLALQFYGCVEAIVATGRPLHFLRFPHFARDADYLWSALKPVFQKHGYEKQQVAAALRDVANLTLINNFKTSGSKGIPEQQQHYRGLRARLQRWMQLR